MSLPRRDGGWGSRGKRHERQGDGNASAGAATRAAGGRNVPAGAANCAVCGIRRKSGGYRRQLAPGGPVPETAMPVFRLPVARRP